ncbi:hypothetical protein TGRUB_230970 [Toxoplasma gondii RUB]|nr:hypothetical protein TGGT1_230970 [Toxoplasma gondii GT1]KFG48397.1 hypothetical protein TGDOM2_230970 [Toxoplasma gondii GAB2-2007-GAL-DOM2]KFG50961.1 hypothetical protein TGP89_230970 [Toxoplasma gondii p89]KFG55448.1 hypothetical protein TGFOU_230970 [Toxoplasma gondii FOU]KFG63644.1 hypothetical protein TGRUB_230970 [Toxoplasma gondii RUB]KFH11050.1 hypothetical protein TGVAND_230970 [Toxoplasma gondii VAND]PIM03293.1 hypothetical protein TGCOUG_230970 [Toxoplasma gondii COUG]PUA92783
MATLLSYDSCDCYSYRFVPKGRLARDELHQLKKYPVFCNNRHFVHSDCSAAFRASQRLRGSPRRGVLHRYLRTRLYRLDLLFGNQFSGSKRTGKMAYGPAYQGGLYSAAHTQYTATNPYMATYVSTPPQGGNYYYVVREPEPRPRKCVFRIICETLGWLASAVVCTACSAACGAASCCINGFIEDEFVPSKPQP